jgi:hypothetical protein
VCIYFPYLIKINLPAKLQGFSFIFIQPGIRLHHTIGVQLAYKPLKITGVNTMIKIPPSRMSCESLYEADWPFFLALQQNADVMRYVADPRTESDIREIFELWSPA